MQPFWSNNFGAAKARMRIRGFLLLSHPLSAASRRRFDELNAEGCWLKDFI